MEHLAKHECEGMHHWSTLYADNDGDWILDAEDDVIEIKFCPFCGLHLPPVAEELIQARKAELDEIERNRPYTKPITMAEFNDGMKIFRENMAAEMLNIDNPFNKLFKE